ncbi:MAG TPA: DUF6193 family natural product biosynthesis protein [Phycisphaerae bacterium]|nr:DUF6193 family natural product biosynthesis protein [Phycisphaerae bacterium]
MDTRDTNDGSSIYMWQRRGAELYPEIHSASAMGAMLESALRTIGSELKVQIDVYALPPIMSVIVAGPERSFRLRLALDERLFLSSFFENGITMANGQTPDIHDTARAVDSWIGKRSTIAELTEFDFIGLGHFAKEYEAGIEVDAQWECFLNGFLDDFPELLAFAVLAKDQPILRQLFPIKSLYYLCFSMCTRHPFYGTGSWIRGGLPGGRYEVTGLENKLLYRGAVLENVLSVVVANIPPDCGPAISGTAHDIIGR